MDSRQTERPMDIEITRARIDARLGDLRREADERHLARAAREERAAGRAGQASAGRVAESRRRTSHRGWAWARLPGLTAPRPSRATEQRWLDGWSLFGRADHR